MSFPFRIDIPGGALYDLLDCEKASAAVGGIQSNTNTT